MNDDRLREAYQAAVGADRPADRTGCVGAGDLRALVEREGGEADRMRHLDHVMSCPACLREFETLRAVRAAEAKDAGDGRTHPSGSGSRSVRRRLARPVAVAASVAAVTVIATIWQQTRSDPVVFRDGGPAAPAALEPVGEVERVMRFRWTGAATAGTYELEVLGPDGATAYRASATDTVHLAPEPTPFESGVTYRWTVTRRSLEEGVTVSEATSFRVR